MQMSACLKRAREYEPKTHATTENFAAAQHIANELAAYFENPTDTLYSAFDEEQETHIEVYVLPDKYRSCVVRMEDYLNNVFWASFGDHLQLIYFLEEVLGR